jgi:hypothetical protein
VLAGLEGFAGKAAWSGVTAWAKHVIAGGIQITLPRAGELLGDAQPLGNGKSCLVRGRLRRLPKDHEIWLLREDERSKKVWPQGFSPVQYDPQRQEWSGRITGSLGQSIKIVAVVAPPTAQDLFRYYQTVGAKLPNYEPLNRVPPECTNRTSVQAQMP